MNLRRPRISVAFELWEIIAMKNFLSIASAGVALVIGISLAGAAEIPARTETTAAAKPTKQVIGDWVLSCALAANGHNACVMSQTLAESKTEKDDQRSFDRPRPDGKANGISQDADRRFASGRRRRRYRKQETHSPFPIPPATVGALLRSM